MNPNEHNDFKYEAERLMHSISTKMEACMRQFYEPFGLTIPQALIILYIHREGSGKVTEVAKQLNMTNSNLSTICRRLEQNGFLIRSRDLEDQRIVWLSLTESCKEKIESLEKQIECQYLSNLGEVSDTDRQIILAGLKKMEEILNRTTP